MLPPTTSGRFQRQLLPCEHDFHAVLLHSQDVEQLHRMTRPSIPMQVHEGLLEVCPEHRQQGPHCGDARDLVALGSSHCRESQQQTMYLRGRLI